MAADRELIELKNIIKIFPPDVVAVDNVTVSFREGEIHSIVGENGAGKSTLMKILAGVYRPDTGSIRIDAEEMSFQNPLDALRAGISMTAFNRDPFKVTIAADALYPNDNTPSLNFGAELSFLERFYLRGGYKDLGQVDSESGLTFGGGVRLFYAARGELLIDYAYQSMKYLNSPQYFSIILYF